MDGQVVAQKLRNEIDEPLQMAIKYYAIISALNGFNLPPKQIQLLAFTAIRGTITPLPARKEFVKLFNSSLASVENIKGKLVAKELIVNIDGKYRVNPVINLDFSKDVVLKIEMLHKTKEEENDGVQGY